MSNPSQATLSLFCCIYFSIKIVLIKNQYLYVCLLLILSNKLELNQETRFTILFLRNIKTENSKFIALSWQKLSRSAFLMKKAYHSQKKWSQN
jgi:hypothetical protein